MSSGGYRLRAGRPGQHSKTEHCRSIDVRQFKREGVLDPGVWYWSWRDPETLGVRASIEVRAAASHVVIGYTIGQEKIFEDIGIVRTACAMGGSRPWFACPQCRARVAILYLHGLRFACRRCHGLAYQSQSAGAMASAFARLRRVQDRMGPNWTKPKGMHWRTAQSLLERAWPLAMAANHLSVMSTDALISRLEGMDLLDDFGQGWQATSRQVRQTG